MIKIFRDSIGRGIGAITIIAGAFSSSIAFSESEADAVA